MDYKGEKDIRVENASRKEESNKLQSHLIAKKDVKVSTLFSGDFDSKALLSQDPPPGEKPESSKDFFSVAAWRSYLLNSNNYFLAIMGGCLSGGDLYIPNNAGNEEAYYSRFLEDKKILGEGEFGVVKLVHDMTSEGGQGEPLACKTLNKGIVFKDNTLYSPLKPHVLKNECEILQTLAGKHFCLDLIVIYESPKHIFLVTELCSGGEMMEYVSKQKSLTTNDFSRIAFQLLSAINHCAKEHILHRDVKPENIMFRSPDPGAQLRLIDFGSGAIDRMQGGSGEPPVHTTHAGTGFYISPEIFQKSYTSLTDVWSCGVTLYVLVAGYPATQLQHAFNILQKPTRDLRTLPGMPKDIPDSFIDLLDQLLCYRYKNRPSAGKMLNHEFVKFHQRKLKAGISIAEVANGAASPKPLTNTRFDGSIKKHSVFVKYQQFERSVTTLLATMLMKKDFEILIERFDMECSKKSETKDAANAKSKLNVITIRHMKTILSGMKQEECIEQMSKLPNAATYENYAYHINLLKQFTQQGNNQGRKSGKDDDLPSSVHGSKVFKGVSASIRGRASRRTNNDQLASSIRSV
mmetsp:Transcript_14439/g.21282  ORF Transcript_14439/g.21282 Transcript_14439/m.21282 type:complete len:577 (-) Transcript_14439:76-1806(-)